MNNKTCALFLWLETVHLHRSLSDTCASCGSSLSLGGQKNFPAPGSQNKAAALWDIMNERWRAQDPGWSLPNEVSSRSVCLCVMLCIFIVCEPADRGGRWVWSSGLRCSILPQPHPPPPPPAAEMESCATHQSICRGRLMAGSDCGCLLMVRYFSRNRWRCRSTWQQIRLTKKDEEEKKKTHQCHFLTFSNRTDKRPWTVLIIKY